MALYQLIFHSLFLIRVTNDWGFRCSPSFNENRLGSSEISICGCGERWHGQIEGSGYQRLRNRRCPLLSRKTCQHWISGLTHHTRNLYTCTLFSLYSNFLLSTKPMFFLLQLKKIPLYVSYQLCPGCLVDYKK